MRVTKNLSQQNVKFVDADDPYVHGYSTSTDSTRMDQDAEMAPLSEFFSRPIKIRDIIWSAPTFTGEFNPWEDFFTNKRVSNRLTNFNLLRATLKVKFVINGNAFYYGRMMVGYTPFLSSDSMTSYTTFADITSLSQLPHIFLNPTTSTGGIITCPFFYNKNAALIPNSDFTDLGIMTYKALNSLAHANDPTFAPVTISVFAWAEDVQLSVLTTNDQDTLIPQAGEIEEANKTGMISGPATSIGRIANALSNIPAISPYAKATEFAAKTVGSVASRFGYCRPTVTKAPDFVRVLPTGSFALTNAPDTSLKLTVDHKQELTIDPRISGIEEEDMMSIVNIAKRESYWTNFEWSKDDSPGQILWNGRVTPVAWQAGPGGAFNFTATAMAALPFKYWTGTLNYRFQIVCSGFHKGRVAVVWDPNFIADAGLPELNIVYSEIIDIAETQDFTVSISNGQPFTLIKNAQPGITSITETNSIVRYSSYEPWSNGVLAVYVLNSLTTPSAEVSADVGVNVYLSASDDFKVFVPDDFFQNFIPTTPVVPALLAPEDEVLEEQSGALIGSNDVDEDMPELAQTHDLFDANTSDMISLAFTGEAIPSFRALLKRYSLWTTIMPSVSPSLAGVNTNFKYAWYPFQRGRYTNATDLAVGAIPYQFANTLLLHWVTYAFAGMRGSIRYKVVPRFRNGPIYGEMAIGVTRYSADTLGEYATPSRFAVGVYTSSSRGAQTSVKQGPYNQMNSFAPIGTNGMAWISTQNSDALEFEVPYYSRYRFAGTRHLGWSAADTWDIGGYYLYFRGSSSGFSPVDMYASVGEDFQPYFFIGLPRMYYEPVPPASV
jgi:hypothetical protein